MPKTLPGLIAFVLLIVIGTACSKKNSPPLIDETYLVNYDEDRFFMFKPKAVAGLKVKQIIGKTPEAQQQEVFLFNKMGQMTAHFMLEAGDTLEAKRYFYNTAGKLLQQKKQGGTFEVQQRYYYDTDERLEHIQQKIKYPNDEALSGQAIIFADIFYTYKGKKVSKSDHRKEERIIYRYNEQAQISSALSSSLFKSNTDTLSLLEWSYDESQRFSKLDMLVVNDGRRFRVQMVPDFNEVGRLQRISRYAAEANGGNPQHIDDFLFVYDKEGRILRINKQESGGELQVLQSFEYKYY